MIKPVPCRKCGGGITLIPTSEMFTDRNIGYQAYCLGCGDLANLGRTRIGAILRWNCKQRRARRAMKGDTKT